MRLLICLVLYIIQRWLIFVFSANCFNWTQGVKCSAFPFSHPSILRASLLSSLLFFFLFSYHSTSHLQQDSCFQVLICISPALHFTLLPLSLPISGLVCVLQLCAYVRKETHPDSYLCEEYSMWGIKQMMFTLSFSPSVSSSCPCDVSKIMYVFHVISVSCPCGEGYVL